MTREEATYPVRRFGGYVVDYAEQYLIPKGWFKSIQSRRPEDLQGPVPWITYPALRVLPQLLRPSFRVLEYGAGGSSLWFATRVAQVVSVEHDRDRAECVAQSGSERNVVVEIPEDAPLEPEFMAVVGPESGRPPEAASCAAEVLRYPPQHFDVVFIDGIAHALCARLAASRLSPAGFVLFDNSDSDVYQAGYDILRSAGFHRVDFWGTGPINPYEWCTSIFTRTLEVF